MSHQESLSLATLGELSAGQSEAIINAALRQAIRDTEDRGADKKSRKVMIEIDLKKIGESVAATVKAKVTMPPYQTETTIGDIKLNERGQPEMVFAPASPHNPKQQTLPIGG
ncbi:MAG TPA: hypothetical protein VGE74_25415 [Gemmata sp.]